MQNPDKKRRMRKSAALFGATLAVGGAALAGAGFGLFTDEENASTNVTAGVVDIDGINPSSLQDAVGPMAIGDTFERVLTIVNNSSVALDKVEYRVKGTDTGSTATADDVADLGNGANQVGDLIADAEGLRLVLIETCDEAYNLTTEECDGTPTPVTTTVSDLTNTYQLVANLAPASDLPVGTNIYLKVAFKLQGTSGDPLSSNNNRFVKDTATIDHYFYAEQRAGVELP